MATRRSRRILIVDDNADAVARELRRVPQLGSIRIIAGIDHYLLKPVDVGFVESLLG